MNKHLAYAFAAGATLLTVQCGGDSAPKCEAPVAPTKGTFADDCDGKGEGARCVLTCTDNLVPSDAAGAQCLSGEWTAPTCVTQFESKLDADGDGRRRFPWGTDYDDDGDGHTQFVLGGDDYNDADKAIYKNTGNGNFVGGNNYPLTTNAGPHAIAVGDINNDGFLDLVTTNQNSNDISILLGKGDGSFEVKAPLANPGESGGGSIVLADFNRDGFLDIQAASSRLLFGKGDGSFTETTPLTWIGVQSTHATDVDNDGILDLIGVSYGTAINVLLGKGDGTWKQQTAIATELNDADQLAIGYLSSDNVIDIAVTTFNSQVISFVGDGDGKFTKKTTVVPSYVSSVAIADINGDNKNDVISANPIGVQINVTLGDGAGELGTNQTFNTPSGSASSMQLFDIDGDNDRDIVGTTQLDGVVISKNTNGTWGNVELINTGNNEFGIGAGDFNRDGKLDLAVISLSSNDLQILIGQ